jgi:hypothetical protein
MILMCKVVSEQAKLAVFLSLPSYRVRFIVARIPSSQNDDFVIMIIVCQPINGQKRSEQLVSTKYECALFIPTCLILEVKYTY